MATTNKNNNDVDDDLQRSIEELKQFFCTNRLLILTEHFNQFISSYTFLKPYAEMSQKVSQFGKHYVSCPWAYDDAKCGPDTCECYSVRRRINEMKNLVQFYKRLTNK